MTVATLAIVSGTLGGLALLTVVVACLPRPPVDLVAAIARIDTHTTRNLQPPVVETSRWWERALEALAARSARSQSRGWGIPTSELDLLDRTPAGYLAARLAWAATGVVVTLVCWLMALVVGWNLPASLMAVVMVSFAMAASLVPAAAVRQDAERAREEFRRALAAYLDLVAQERASGRAPSQALAEAATVAEGWVFLRIHVALSHALHLGITPWESLARLAARVGVDELADLADIVASAADGAAVYTTLTAKASSLRASALAKDTAEANVRSHRLVIPVSVLLIGFLLLVLFPAMIRLFTS